MCSLAALWERRDRHGEKFETFTVETMSAWPALAELHHRQPLALAHEATRRTPSYEQDIEVRGTPRHGGSRIGSARFAAALNGLIDSD